MLGAAAFASSAKIKNSILLICYSRNCSIHEIRKEMSALYVHVHMSNADNNAYWTTSLKIKLYTLGNGQMPHSDPPVFFNLCQNHLYCLLHMVLRVFRTFLGNLLCSWIFVCCFLNYLWLCVVLKASISVVC